MDHANTLIRLLSEGGWRLGLPLALIGFLVLLAHKTGLPEPGAVAPFVGWATLAAIAGTAFTLVSIITHTLTAVANKIRAIGNQRREQREFDENIQANLQALSPAELLRLREILASGQNRVQVSVLNDAWGLVQKGILRQVSGSLDAPVCEVPSILITHRTEIVSGIESVMRDRPRLFTDLDSTLPFPQQPSRS